MSQILFEGIPKIKTRSTNLLGKASLLITTIKQISAGNYWLWPFPQQSIYFAMRCMASTQLRNSSFLNLKTALNNSLSKNVDSTQWDTTPGGGQGVNTYFFWMSLLICLTCNIRPITAIIFGCFSFEVSCACIFLHKIMNKSTAIAFMYFIWHSKSFKAAEEVTMYTTSNELLHCRHDFPWSGLPGSHNLAAIRASSGRWLIPWLGRN